MGLLIGYLAGVNYEKENLASALSIIHPIRENDPSYEFINPLLAYIIPGADQQEDFASLKNAIINEINAEKKHGKLIDASVFLSDLNKGRWIGVNENEKYTPASMLKVVIMVAYYKRIEREPDILDRKLTYTGDLDRLLKQDVFNSRSVLGVGTSYPVGELIKMMIIESDNGAEFLLLNNIDASYLSSIYEVLDIENPEYTSGSFTISPRTYSLFFRILYSVTYLRKGNSEQVLDILSKTTFKDGIVAGLPGDIPVAHKFGEHVNAHGSQITSIELHDCGIVYASNSPYFLCVMTRGDNLDALKGIIKNISSLVYENYKK